MIYQQQGYPPRSSLLIESTDSDISAAGMHTSLIPTYRVGRLYDISAAGIHTSLIPTYRVYRLYDISAAGIPTSLIPTYRVYWLYDISAAGMHTSLIPTYRVYQLYDISAAGIHKSRLHSQDVLYNVTSSILFARIDGCEGSVTKNWWLWRTRN